MTIDTLVFCTMVYDWYYIGCNNAIIAPIIAVQCKDPIIIQQVNNYKTQIDIRIKQIIVPPPRDGGGNGNDTDTNQTNGESGNNNMSVIRGPITCAAIGGCDGVCSPGETENGCAEFGYLAPSEPPIKNNSRISPPIPPGEGADAGTGGDNDNVTLSIPSDPCIENPSLPECTTGTPQALISDPCIENPSAEGCETPPPPPPTDDGDTDNTNAGDIDTDDGASGGDGGDNSNDDNSESSSVKESSAAEE
jgi:hypothetical protein